MNRNRAAALLAPLIVLLLAIGGYLLLRADEGVDLADGDGTTDVAEDPTATPSEIATDAAAGGADGADGQPEPTPSEVGTDAATGGGSGAGAVGGDGDDDGGDTEDPTVDGDDGTAGAGGNDDDSDGETDGGEDAAGSGDGEDVAGAGDGDGDTDGDDSGADGSGDDGTDDGEDRDVAGGFGEDTEDADLDGDLPETGSSAIVAGLAMMLLGATVRPRR